jgi:hypothetical protein
MTPLELLVFGGGCYLIGFVCGAVVIPWLVDHHLFPAQRPNGEE